MRRHMSFQRAYEHHNDEIKGKQEGKNLYAQSRDLPRAMHDNEAFSDRQHVKQDDRQIDVFRVERMVAQVDPRHEEHDPQGEWPGIYDQRDFQPVAVKQDFQHAYTYDADGDRNFPPPLRIVPFSAIQAVMRSTGRSG